MTTVRLPVETVRSHVLSKLNLIEERRRTEIERLVERERERARRVWWRRLFRLAPPSDRDILRSISTVHVRMRYGDQEATCRRILSVIDVCVDNRIDAIDISSEDLELIV